MYKEKVFRVYAGDVLCPDHMMYHRYVVPITLCPFRDKMWSVVRTTWALLNAFIAKNMTENIMLDSFLALSSGFRRQNIFLGFSNFETTRSDKVIHNQTILLLIDY